MGSTRRTILATGAAATAMAAAQRVFAQQTGKGGAAMSVYERGPVRIHYEEAGSGFPLLLIAGGGPHPTIPGQEGAEQVDPIPQFNADDPRLPFELPEPEGKQPRTPAVRAVAAPAPLIRSGR